MVSLLALSASTTQLSLEAHKSPQSPGSAAIQPIPQGVLPLLGFLFLIFYQSSIQPYTAIINQQYPANFIRQVALILKSNMAIFSL